MKPTSSTPLFISCCIFMFVSFSAAADSPFGHRRGEASSHKQWQRGNSAYDNNSRRFSDDDRSNDKSTFNPRQREQKRSGHSRSKPYLTSNERDHRSPGNDSKGGHEQRRSPPRDQAPPQRQEHRDSSPKHSSKHSPKHSPKLSPDHRRDPGHIDQRPPRVQDRRPDKQPDKHSSDHRYKGPRTDQRHNQHRNDKRYDHPGDHSKPYTPPSHEQHPPARPNYKSHYSPPYKPHFRPHYRPPYNPHYRPKYRLHKRHKYVYYRSPWYNTWFLAPILWPYYSVGFTLEILPSPYVRIVVGSLPYYYAHGTFYRPYSSGYIVVSAPIGAVVTTLPSGYIAFSIGLDTYYFVNDAYYVWDEPRDGFVVVSKPQGAERAMEQATQGRLYVYPNEGQSAEQEAKDRYACHLWAVSESGVDPTVEEQEYSDREQYDYKRAMAACLEGRGYTVK